MRIAVMLVLAGLAASGAMAAPADRTGYRAIAAGDWAQATERLEAERRIHPGRPELMLNLAAAYWRTGRAAEARALYAAVMTRPTTMMDLPDGAVASSRDLAAMGLARTADTAVAAR